MRPKIFLAIALVGLATTSVSAWAEKSAIFSSWANSKGGLVTFTTCEDKICGYVSKLNPRYAGVPVDKHHPDPSMRDRPLLGLVVLSDFSYAGKKTWKGGKLYNTKDGVTYRSKMKVLDDGRLKVSACILFACLSEKFTPAPDAPAFSAPPDE